jgi:hypothetical protein
VVALVAARYELVRELRVDTETVEWEAFDSALDRPVVVQLLRPELAHDAAVVERFWQATRAAARQTAVPGERVLDGGTDPETGQLFVVRERPALASPAPAMPQFIRRKPAGTPRAWPRFETRPRWLVVGGAVVLLVLAATVIRAGVDGWLAWVNSPLGRTGQSLGLAPAVAVPASGAQPGQGTSTPAAAPPTVAPAVRAAPQTTPAPTTIATPSATGTAVGTGQSRKVVGWRCAPRRVAIGCLPRATTRALPSRRSSKAASGPASAAAMAARGGC